LGNPGNIKTKHSYTLDLIPAILKDQALLQDADRFRKDEKNFQVWWLGQSGYLLQWNGKRVLIDPYLSDSLTKKYAATAKPHVRMSERVIDPSLLTGISIITSSHNHTDHLDAETIIPVLQNNPAICFIIPEANRVFVTDRVSCDVNFPVGLNDQEQVSMDGFTFYGIPARHNEVERDDQGNCKYMGYVIQFGGWTIYHSGDTLWFDGMVDLLRPFGVDLALLPINGNDPARGVAGNLNALEAVDLGIAINAGTVIPCHYNMFAFNTADPDEFAREAKKRNQPFAVLQPGERWDSRSR
jgi:L-ascorbate metabolism protein UlaG (beta-lactamase superfamily)